METRFRVNTTMGIKKNIMLEGNKNYILKITHQKRHDLGVSDYNKFYNLLKSFTPIETVYPKIRCGYYYDNVVINDSRGIGNGGWRVPSDNDWFHLSGHTETVFEESPGRHLKSKKTINSVFGWEYDLDINPRWEDSEHYGVDSFGFNALPCGRFDDFIFIGMNIRSSFWSSTKTKETFEENEPILNHFFRFLRNSSEIDGPVDPTTPFFCINVRLVREATDEELGVDDGTEMGDYIGNDGQNYKTVKIGNLLWLKENLMETKYRNGNNILNFSNKQQPYVFGDANNAGEVSIETNSLKINKINANGRNIYGWLNKIIPGTSCILYKKNKFSSVWAGINLLTSDFSENDYVLYNFDSSSSSSPQEIPFNVGDELIVISLEEGGYRYTLNDDDSFVIYPREKIENFNEISMNDLFNMTHIEYGVRVKELMKKHISLPQDRTNMVNERKI